MRILLVDDSKLQRKFIASIIEKAGHECFMAENGQDGIDKYESLRPDLVILDVEMPDVKGFDVAKKIREMHREDDASRLNWVPIIFLSSIVEEDYLDKCIQSGGDDYIFKPPTAVILNAKIFAMERIVSLQRQVYDQKQLVKQKESAESIQKFSSGVALEIRNPLAEMIQASQTLVRRLDKDLPANQRIAEELEFDLIKFDEFIKKRGIMQAANEIKNSGFKISDITNNLLQVAGDTSKEKTEAFLSNLLDKAIHLVEGESLSNQLDLKQIDVIKNYSTLEKSIMCCTKEIEQVFYIVLKNAAQAMAEDVEEPSITLNIIKEENAMVAEVINKGNLVDAEVSEHIFDPFYTTKKKGEGIGLGMTVAYNIIVNKHGGEIKFSSDEEVGTKVRIALPYE